MSTTWPEGLDSEYDEYDDAELYDDSEYDDGEYDDAESRASKRRKAARQKRARQVALARSRSAQRRGSGRLPATVPSRSAAQKAVAAVRDLDLETKVVRDDFRSSDAKQSKRMSRSEYATVASILITQGLQTFGRPDNEILLAAIQASPLLLLAPERKGSGFEAVVKDPRVIGLAGVAGLVTFNELRDRGSSVKRVDILGPSELLLGQSDVFIADVFDSRDRPSTVPVVWSTNRPDLITVNATTGEVTALQLAGVAIVTATADKVVVRRRLEVKTPPTGHDSKK